MPNPSLTRIAPTPSGYLHVGNLANFLFIEKLAGEQGAEVLLRIDDCDGTRARPEFVEHIFETLRWLGIGWQRGPRDAGEFYRAHSQTLRKAYYFERLRALAPYTYACTCSRREISGIYQGTCREKGLAFVPGETALRLHVNDAHLAELFGDVVLWRKDDGPAYQWASVVDDLEWNVSLVVRGEDLRDSSELQKYIAALAQPGGFGGVRFVHHPLLTDGNGKKLSKSLGAESVLALRKAGIQPGELRARLGAEIGAWGK
jgi:glutamyl/glutaminyl-tRNA synthetase